MANILTGDIWNKAEDERTQIFTSKQPKAKTIPKVTSTKPKQSNTGLAPYIPINTNYTFPDMSGNMRLQLPNSNPSNYDSIYGLNPNIDSGSIPIPAEKGWFEQIGGLGGVGQGLTGLANLGTGIANIVMSDKYYGLAKDQYNFEKNAFNTNLMNQSKLINNKIDALTSTALASRGLYNNSGNELIQAEYDKAMAKAKDKYVSSTPIG